MKIITCVSPKKIRIEQVDIPQVTNDKVLVKILFCGICSYDLKRYLGLKKINYPVILGHEPAGIVEETGTDIQELKRGEKVVMDVKTRCGICPPCMKGMESRCYNSEASNGFSQYMLLPQVNVHKVALNFDLITGIFTEPLACIIHGFKKIDLQKKSNLLVIGDGIMGILACFLGKLIKNKKVTLFGHHDERLRHAKKLDTECVNIKRNNISRFKEFDTIIFTIEEKKILERIDENLCLGANVLLIGELRDGIYSLNLKRIYSNEYCFVGSKGYDRRDFQESVEIIAKYSDILTSFIDKIYDMGELDKAFVDLQNRKILKGVLNLHN